MFKDEWSFLLDPIALAKNGILEDETKGLYIQTSENKREQDLPSLFHAVMELWHSDTGAGRYCQLRSPGKASVEQSTGNSEQTSLLCL